MKYNKKQKETVNLELKNLKGKISMLPLEQQKEMLKLLEEYETAKEKDSAKTDFLPFVRMMWSGFIGGPHHEIMAEAFEKVARGPIIFMALVLSN